METYFCVHHFLYMFQYHDLLMIEKRLKLKRNIHLEYLGSFLIVMLHAEPTDLIRRSSISIYKKNLEHFFVELSSSSIIPFISNWPTTVVNVQNNSTP